MSLQNPYANLTEFIKKTITLLSTPKAKNSRSTVNSFLFYLSKTLPSKEKSDEMFEVISNFIFRKENNNKIIKDPFILFPIIFSSSPKFSKCYLDNIFNIISKTINDINRPSFSFISQVFGEIINSLYNTNSPNTNILLSREDEMKIYNNLLKFCLDNIKKSKKNEQTCGCLQLAELIENCPIVKETSTLKSLWEMICIYLDDKFFFAKLEILNCLISLIFAAETKFKPYATVTLFKILDYLNDIDWMKRKLALNVIYTLSFYCKREILPFKEHIIEYLNVLKSDKIGKVKEVCIQTLKFLQENQEGYEEMEKAKKRKTSNEYGSSTPSVSSLSSKMERLSTERRKRNTGRQVKEKKNERFSSIDKKAKTEKNLTLNSSILKFNRKYPNRLILPSSSLNGIGHHIEKIKQLKKEQLILERIEKDILNKTIYSPIKSPNDNKKKKNRIPRFFNRELSKGELSVDIKSKTPNHKIDLKIKLGKSHSENKIMNSQLNKNKNYRSKSEIIDRENNLNLKECFNGNTEIKEEEYVIKEEVDYSPKFLQTFDNSSSLVNQILEDSSTEEKKEELHTKSNSLFDNKLLGKLNAQIKNFAEKQNIILSILTSLTSRVNSNYTDLNNRLNKVENSINELSKNEQSIELNTSTLKIENSRDNLQIILDAIKENNFTLALNLSILNDNYLFHTISQITSDKIKLVDNNTLEIILSRIIALIPRGEHLDEMIQFCDFILTENIIVKSLTKQNLKDVIGFLFKNKQLFKVSEETSKTIDNLKILLSASFISNV